MSRALCNLHYTPEIKNCEHKLLVAIIKNMQSEMIALQYSLKKYMLT